MQGVNTGAPLASRQRKVRKGTSSCWECKRRKMKCLMPSPSDNVCIACRRRGSACVSQRYPEGTTPTTSVLRDRDRIVRVEAMVQRLFNEVRFTGGDEAARTAASDGDPMADAATGEPVDGSELTQCPSSLNSMSTRPTPDVADGAPRSSGDLSASLHAALPPKEDIQLVIKAGLDVSLHKLITHPYPVLAENFGRLSGSLAETPSASAHPVLLARYLLILATCLQYLHPELHAQEIRCMSKPPRQLMRCLADAAIANVTSNDELLDSIKGLECVMLESMFEANSGHLRRAWFACRHAMLVAQMMGLHRGPQLQQPIKMLDPSQPAYPRLFWYRIVCTDRQLCLMLGLPQGSTDVSMASEDALQDDTPEGRFERKQTVIAARILVRNDTSCSNPAVLDDLDALRETDALLQEAASDMPAKWWLVPNLASVVLDPEKTFWETIRLFDQMLYFNLANLLHLPYLLRSQTDDLDDARFDHSKLACANASRQLLTRFVMFRSFNRVSYACRSVDFFALIAGLTLLIAHLDGHLQQRQQRGHGSVRTVVDVLAQQRNMDRAMIEQVLESMDGIAKLNTDILSERASGLLKELLVFETDAAQGKVSRSAASGADDGEQFLRIGIPYFGTVQISRQGEISVEGLLSNGHPSSREQPGKQIDAVIHAAQCSMLDQVGSDTAAGQHDPVTPSVLGLDGLTSHQLHESPVQLSNVKGTLAYDQFMHPGLTAAMDDWAFQGADMAFFDNLTRRADLQDPDGGAGWAY
ncbi:hypothetical protein HIM_08827 [Hirsutella minnesotensis 3608]|uniref:Zn(2)-C6 fungal-type domain-containing protein n=1 Tax=Hirsutella minnesotensis 3608 TaxID=1043627 RepID=A0A0F7ZY40_9HYPO|nr:hypothetical protein HIM_08827 [Hirsutella minnesotensis 3608]